MTLGGSRPASARPQGRCWAGGPQSGLRISCTSLMDIGQRGRYDGASGAAGASRRPLQVGCCGTTLRRRHGAEVAARSDSWRGARSPPATTRSSLLPTLRHRIGSAGSSPLPWSSGLPQCAERAGRAEHRSCLWSARSAAIGRATAWTVRRYLRRHPSGLGFGRWFARHARLPWRTGCGSPRATGKERVSNGDRRRPPHGTIASLIQMPASVVSGSPARAIVPGRTCFHGHPRLS